MSALPERGLDVFIVAGEESGDALGGPLMRALRRRDGAVSFRGIGGDRMLAEGLESQFAMEDITAMGFGAVVAKLPLILRRLRETVASILADPPDVLVLIDSPDFTHRVASRVRRRRPDIPIVKYVAPTVWAWRAGRAKAMRPSIDHVLALFPFEPEVMRRLGGPPTTYVGHPLLSEIGRLRPDAAEAERRAAGRPLLLALPGSRRQEVRRLAQVFGATFGRLAAAGHDFELVLPTTRRLLPMIREVTANWPVQPRIVAEEGDKLAAFREARAALAASGTVTLELALAGVPLVGAYKVSAFEAEVGRHVLTVPSVLLANIILDETVVPEFLQQDCNPETLEAALAPLLQDGPERRAQLEGFERLAALMSTDGLPGEDIAAEVVERLALSGAGQARQIAPAADRPRARG